MFTQKPTKKPKEEKAAKKTANFNLIRLALAVSNAQRQHLAAFAITLLFLLPLQLYSMADISFVVIDLKYSEEQGVKICEMQPGSFSRYSGAPIASEMYCEFLEQFHVPVYFTHPLFSKLKEEFVKRGWSSIHSLDNIPVTSEKKGAKDPDNLFDYSSFLFSLNTNHSKNGDPTAFPQILFLDRAILPYSESKLVMNLLFNINETTRKLRPQWKLYRKGTSESLTNAIIQDIPGDLIVIKPLESTMGRGVIIIEKSSLQSTLNYIFNSPKEVLLADMERSYSHYAVDKSDYFIVEEFIESDPLFLGPDALPYDCTIRLMAILSYHQRIPEVTFLAGYWYSPHKPLDSAYTLIQSHKAKGTFFCPITPETMQEIEKQLRPGLLTIYQKMLDLYDARYH